jgi:hypothetical protein
MATYEQVIEALRNADASGNTKDAERLADIASKMRMSQEQPKGTYVPEIDPASGAATGGMTFVPEVAPMPYSEQIKRSLSAVGTGADIAARTFASGASLGYADKLAAAMSSGDYEKNLAVERARTEQAKQAMGSLGAPTEIAGGIAGVAAMAPISITARMAGAAPTLANLAKTILAGGVEGGTLGALEAKGRDQDVASGAVLGTALGAGIPGILGAASRAISPLRQNLTPAQQAAVSTAAAREIPLTPGQLTQTKPLRYLESQLENISGFGQTGEQQQAINREVAKTFGAKATEIDSDVVNNSFNRIGKEFDRLTQNKTIDTGAAFKNEVQQILNEYERNIPTDVRDVFVSRANDLINLGSRSTGDDLQKIRSTLARLERGGSPSNEYNLAISKLRESVDDAFERSLSKQDAADLRKAREQYKNLIIVADSLGTSAEAQAGNVSLKNIANVLANRDEMGFARGRGGELEKLSRVSGLLANPPSSGSSERTYVTNLLGALGGLAGYQLADTTGALIGLATPMAAGMAYNNPVTRAYLLNQAAAPLERAIPAFTRYGTTAGLLSTETPQR